jgi:mannose-1-phosphate guanylyltransferase / mannose-6-phosphate isomerase
VTFGVAPARAETGYGYLELDAGWSGEDPPAPLPLRRFVEKPDAAAAEAMLAGGRHLWNAASSSSRCRRSSRPSRPMPPLAQAVRRAVAGAVPDLNFLRLDPGPGGRRRGDLDRLRGDGEGATSRWCPMAAAGPTSAPGTRSARDGAGRDGGGGLGRPGTAIDCENSLLRPRAPSRLLVGIGLRNIVAVAMRDAVLVADMADGQRVKEAVER